MDYVRAILEIVLEDFRAKTGIDLRYDAEAMKTVEKSCERAALEVERRGIANVSAPFLVFDGSRPVHLDLTLTRDEVAARAGATANRKEGSRLGQAGLL
ncbi:MAG: Hsp70 family protein [Firmicutes bacterium]|jgi:molecular chaperone DnaK|nr:Hsp70 family protein [Bacillota bacterium]